MRKEDKHFLCQLVGEGGFVLEPAAMAPYLTEPRGWFEGQASLVLRPSCTEQVAQIVRYAHQKKLNITPQGGNTGLVGGQIPHNNGQSNIIVSLERLNKIRVLDKNADLAIVEAGVTLQNFQEAVAEVGKFFPLSIASRGSCQIGGNLSTNAGGLRTLAYGTMRDLCQGLEVVLPNGEILHNLSCLKKDNSGYDLRNLFIGAEGTLGIITASVLKIFPPPRSIGLALCEVKEVKQALALFNFLQQEGGAGLTAFELINREAYDLACGYLNSSHALPKTATPWLVLCEFSSMHSTAQKWLAAMLHKAMEDNKVQQVFLASNARQEQHFWHMRESISPAQKAAGLSIKHDISLPFAALSSFVAQAEKEIKTTVPEGQIICFGHIGDGNLHYDILLPKFYSKAEFFKLFEQVNKQVYAIVAALGGSFSAEHGIGRWKIKEMQHFKDKTALLLMQKIKNSLDPQGIMNPKKVLPPLDIVS